MESLLSDIKYGVRNMARSPGFTTLAVLALSLRIGANTAIFSVANAVLFDGVARTVIGILRSGFKLAGRGVDLFVPLAATRFISSLLFGVSDKDPIILAAAMMLLAAVAALASYIPARRASSIDPTAALRCE